MRFLTLIVLVALLAFAPVGPKALAAPCVPDTGPGIPAPTATPAKLPGFHAAWSGRHGASDARVLQLRIFRLGLWTDG
jgi:hypothetical protein